MLFDNPKFTDRQREIITTIGKEQRDLIDKEKKVNIIGFTVTMILILVALILLATFSGMKLGITIIIGIGTLILFPSIISRKCDILNDVKKQEDYDIGLRYINLSPKIVGNAKKKLKAIRLFTIIMSSMALFITLLVFIINANMEVTDFSKLNVVRGTIEDVKYINDDYIDIKIKDSKTKFRIQSLYLDALDIKEFKKAALKDKEVTMFVDGNENSATRFVHFVGIDEVVFLDEFEVIKADRDNIDLGWLICIISAICTVGFFGFYFIYKWTIYKKNKAKEIYDFDYTEEEIDAIQVNNEEIDTSDVYIKTTYPKWMLIFFIVGCVISLGLIILGLFIKEPEGTWACIAMGLFFGLLSSLGLYDLTKHYELLDKDTLIVNRFFKKKRINIRDIKCIRINGQVATIVDRSSKNFCMISTMTKGLFDILEVLEKLGISIELNM